MNPCPQCGAIPQPSDKFCNICGTPTAAPGYGAPAQGGFPPPPQNFGAPPPAYGAPPGPPGGPLRCQMGHDIAPGASYCPHGHPIALEAMGFANDQYGGGGGYPPPQQQGGFGAPPAQGFPGQQPGGGGFGQPMPGGGGYGTDAPPAGYGQQPYPDPNAPYGQQPQQPYPDPQYGQYGQPGGFGAPPQQGFGQQPGFGAPPQAGFGAPPAPAYGQAPQGGFGPQPGFGAPEAAQPPPVPQPIQLPPNALRGFLVSYQSNTQGDFWPLHGGRKTVGRANSGEQVDIPLSDATISSRHAALIVDGTQGTLQLEDTGSTNGTFVNEEHIGFNGKRELRDGDKVRFGGYTTIVKLIGRP